MKRSKRDWAEILKSQAESGLSAKAYCEREGYSLGSFRVAKHKQMKEDTSNARNFLELDFGKYETKPILEIRLDQDWKWEIRLNISFEVRA